MSRRHRVRTAHGRLGALNGRRGRETGLVVIEQRATAFAGPSLQTGKFVGAGGKLFRVAVFFRLIRVRLKESGLNQKSKFQASFDGLFNAGCASVLAYGTNS